MVRMVDWLEVEVVGGAGGGGESGVEGFYKAWCQRGSRSGLVDTLVLTMTASRVWVLSQS